MSQKKERMAFTEKFELWTKFMQAGKTREMTNVIEELATSDEDYYHIIFCSNNLFLTNQTQNRVDITLTNIDQSLISYFGDNLKAIVYSSSNKNCQKYDQLLNKFNNYRAILCCTNHWRFSDIQRLLTDQFNDNQRVIVWIDEIHSKLDKTLEFLFNITTLNCIKKIIGISATPDNIFANRRIGKKNKIQLKPMKACNSDIYYGFYNIKKKIVDIDAKDYKIPKIISDQRKKYNCCDAIKLNNQFVPSSKIENALYLHTLFENKQIEYGSHDIFYVPGQKYKLSHDAIRDVLLYHGFYVFVFNSDGSYLYKTTQEKLQISDKTVHLGQLMGNTRINQKLTDKAIGITGYLSIGQGNTLCDFNTDFYITKGVIGYNDVSPKNEFVTQVFGRCFGNIKNREKFNGSTIFMRNKFAKNIEHCVLSGGLSEFALTTGQETICYDDLKKSKKILKEIYCNDEKDNYDDDEKKTSAKNIPNTIIDTKPITLKYGNIKNEVIVEWNFDNNKDVELFKNANPGDTIQSEQFEINGCSFLLELNPNGCHEEEETNIWCTLHEFPEEIAAIQIESKCKCDNVSVYGDGEITALLTKKKWPWISGKSRFRLSRLSSVIVGSMLLNDFKNLNCFSFQCSIKIIEFIDKDGNQIEYKSNGSQPVQMNTNKFKAFMVHYDDQIMEDKLPENIDPANNEIYIKLLRDIRKYFNIKQNIKHIELEDDKEVHFGDTEDIQYAFDEKDDDPYFILNLYVKLKNKAENMDSS